MMKRHQTIASPTMTSSPMADAARFSWVSPLGPDRASEVSMEDKATQPTAGIGA